MGAGSATLITTGMLPMVLIAAAVLSAPAALFLLWLYRRAVLRAMATASARAGLPAQVPPQSVPGSAAGPLQVRHIDPLAAQSSDALVRARRSLGAQGAIQLAGAAAYAAVFALAWSAFDDQGFVPARLLWLALCYAWPGVIAIALVAAVSRAQRTWLAGGYFLLLALAAGYVHLMNPGLGAGALAFLWLYINAAPSVLIAVFLHRRVRAVGPLVVTFMLAAVAGSLVLVRLVAASDASLRSSVAVGASLGLGATGVLVGLLLAGFALFGLAGWWLLKLLGERYRRRAISDQSLTLDAIWLGFGIVQSISLSFQGWIWIFTGVVAFGACKLTTRALAALVREGRGGRGPTLLWLRVFALGRRSERLFDALSKLWLRLGGITLIGGPDLVTSTVEPHEFLAFVGGELSRRFVLDGEDLRRRIDGMAHGPDPDGRHRVSEFLCYADTWQPTMRALAASADAVLMDLRGFAPGNQGCVFELEQLLAGTDLRRVLLLVDATTDEPFLERVLHDAWARAGVGTAGSTAEIRVLRATADASRAAGRLLGLLLGSERQAARPHAGPVVAA